MSLNSQSTTQDPFIIPVISKCPLSSADQEVEMGLCLLGAPKHENMFVCPHLQRLSELTFGKNSSEGLYGGTRSLLQMHLPASAPDPTFSHFSSELRDIFQCLDLISFFSLKHTYHIYRGSSFIISLTLRKECQHKYEYL